MSFFAKKYLIQLIKVYFPRRNMQELTRLRIFEIKLAAYWTCILYENRL